MKRNTSLLFAILILLGSSTLFPTKTYACSSEPFLGSICMFGGNFTIRNFAMANGQLLPISQNSALFSLLGTTYGGDGRTTFALPDLRGRAPVGFGQGPGLPRVRLGEKGGVVQVTLTTVNLPSHNHDINVDVAARYKTASTATLKALSASATTNNPEGALLSNPPGREKLYATVAPNVKMRPDAIDVDVQVEGDYSVKATSSNTGGSVPINIRNPYLGVNFQIALQGIFPSRS